MPLPQPRHRLDPAFHRIVDEIYAILTSRATASIEAHGEVHGGLAQPLLEVPINRNLGFIELLASPRYGGHTELPTIAAPLALEINDLFPIAEALHILEFAELKDGAIKLTAAGRLFAQSDTDARKRLFREHLLRFVPLAAHIHHTLEIREEHRAPRVRFESELEDHLNARDTDKTLRKVTGWGRYAELFTYDDTTRMFAIIRRGE